MQTGNVWLKRGILFLHLGLLLLFFLLGYIGHYGFDDMQYAEIAHDLLNGQLNFDDHFSFRFTIVFLTSISYAIFGLNDFASALPSLLLTAVVLVMLYQVLKRDSASTVFIGLSLCLLSEWFLAYSNKLMPDMYLASFLSFAIYFYWNYKFNSKSVKLNSFLMALSLFLAFNSKGTIVLAIPLFIYLLLTNIKSKSDKKFWLSVLVHSLLLFVSYFLLIEYYTGSFFKRFEAIYSNTYLNRCSYDQQSTIILLKRLFRDLFALFQREGMLAPYLFLVVLFFVPKIEKETRFWGYTALILLLASNFMSISIDSYNPMCLDTRHYLFLAPIGAIAAAKLLATYFENLKARILVIILTLLIGCYSFYDQNEAFSSHYLLIIIALIISQKFNSKPWVLATLLFFGLSIKPYQQIRYAQDVNYFKQAEIIKDSILPLVENSYLICNKVQSRLINYYGGFAHETIHLLTYDNFDLDTLDQSKDIYLLENWHSRSLMFYTTNDLPFYVRYPSETNEIIYESATPKLRLSKMNEFLDPDQLGKIEFETKNDFEQNYDHWQQKEIHINEQLVKDGKRSLLCSEYSSTLILPLDSMIIDSSSYYITTDVDFWVADKTEAALIISLENSNGSWNYNSQRLESAVISYSNWANQSLSSYVQPFKYKSGSTLKVYVYNPDLNTIYLDNFSVHIKKIK